jgi:hypothetical protein
MHDEPMIRFDPRAWNLTVGAALMVGGCSSRPVDEGAEETSTAMGSTDDGSDTDTDTEIETTDTETETTDTPETADTDDSSLECRTDDDCYYNFQVCYGGFCQFFGECFYEDSDCCTFEVCGDEFECIQVGESLPECPLGWSEIPTVPGPSGVPLALSFADVDNDGPAELVVANATHLLVYRFGVDGYTATERAVPSDWLRTMVAGQFDAQPGEDVILLIDDELHRYFSDGVSGFVNPIVQASPVSYTDGVLAGNFDGQDLTDLLIFGSDGAELYLGSDLMPAVVFTQRPVGSAAAFDYDSPFASFMIGSEVFTLTGTWIGQMPYDASVPRAAVASPEEGHFVVGFDHFASFSCAAWIELEQWDAVTVTANDSLYQEGDLAVRNAIGAGDFDGDQVDELITHGDFGVRFIHVFGDPCMRVPDPALSSVEVHAIGDHDGDGDDELALGFASQVVILDGE